VIDLDRYIKRIRQKICDCNVILTNTIAADKIRNVEELYKITLPEELFRFYTEIANGCIMIDGYHLKHLKN
jgi:hypothetical protein